jgi:mycothiol synthase
MTTRTDDATLILAGTPPIAGLRFRRVRAGDPTEFMAIADLIGITHREDQVPWLPTARQLQDELEGSSEIDVGRDLILAELDGRLVGYAGQERVMRDGVPVYELWGNVHPEVRRRGIGGTLLRANERRVAERAATEPPGQAVDLATQVDETQVGYRALVESAGYETIRWFFLMRRPTLDDIPDAPLPDGIELRPVEPDQIRPILHAENEAFRDHWAAREQTEDDIAITLGRVELATDLWVVAWAGEEIAGVVQNWIWTDENKGLGVQRGWLEHISVRRPWRRRGLARAITAESLRRLQAAGMTEAMLGVDSENPNGALGLYEGLGFQVDMRSASYRRSLER